MVLAAAWVVLGWPLLLVTAAALYLTLLTAVPVVTDARLRRGG